MLGLLPPLSEIRSPVFQECFQHKLQSVHCASGKPTSFCFLQFCFHPQIVLPAELAPSSGNCHRLFCLTQRWRAPQLAIPLPPPQPGPASSLWQTRLHYPVTHGTGILDQQQREEDGTSQLQAAGVAGVGSGVLGSQRPKLGCK